MMYSNIPSAQTLVLFFQSWGIKNIIISPGSRNAPLTLGFTKNPYFNSYSIVDERCAAFFALGMAQQLKEPVAVVCTSGSAMLNYYPAVAEAFYSDVPLIVVSADRPGDKIDIGDGQTIRQENIFEKHIGYSANLKQDAAHSRPNKIAESQLSIQGYNERELGKALRMAIETSSPVHVNIPFEEPLYGLTDHQDVHIPLHEEDVHKEDTIVDWNKFKRIWEGSGQKMVLGGVNPPDHIEQETLNLLATDESVIVFTETTSNVHHERFFPSIDSIIAPIEKSTNQEVLFQKLQPEVLITFGGLIVSKKIKAFLRTYQPKQHWHINPKKAYDTFYCLTDHVKMDFNQFVRALYSDTKIVASGYQKDWLKTKSEYERKRTEYLGKIAFSDFAAFDVIQKGIPKSYQVHLANSSTVRYTQLFPMDSSLAVYCNRGTSGIDGSTSTAIGASIHHDNPTLLLTGDLSFFYDSNGLWNQYIRSDFRIILINNSGGGIFRILPGFEETEEFSTFFETQHSREASHLAAMYQLEYKKVATKNALENALSEFFEKSEQPKILEVLTPRALNNKILLDYFDFIS